MPFTTFRRISLPIRMACAAIIAFLWLSAYSASPTFVDAQSQSRYFAATGYSVSGAFLSFFDRYGGLRIFGYPISGVMFEEGRQVQYFERQRFEYHTEAAGTFNEVELSRLGQEFAPQKAVTDAVLPFQSHPDLQYFSQTGHSLGSPFLDYWRENGGLRIMGYPVSEQVSENGLTVQYFERARMEYHPEKAASGFIVELGLLGKMYVDQHPELAATLVSSRAVSPVSRGPEPAPQAAHATQATGNGSSATPLSDKEAGLLGMINEARRQAGTAPVSLDTTIRNLALARSKDMVARNYFSHTAPDGTDFISMLKSANVSFRFTGEIITNNNYSEDSTMAQAFSSFMGSIHHHDILLDTRFTQAGVGEAVNDRGFYYYTVIFVQK